MNTRSTVATALRWSVGGKAASQLVSWLSTLLVIRLLHPEDYGLMAMAASVTALAALLNEMGATTAIVQRPNLEHEDLRALLGATVLCNVALFLLLAVSAPAIARYFQAPAISTLLSVLALRFPIQSVGIIHASLMVRHLDFKTKSLIEAGATLVGSLATLGLALLGLGVWALVLGSLIMAGVSSLAFSLLSPKRYRPSFRLARALPLVRFGGVIVAQRVLWWFYSQIDILLLGRLYRADAVGVYSVARELAALPNHKLGAILNQITLASFSRVQHDTARVRHYLLQGIRMLAFAAVPTFAAISALAPEAVYVFLGAQWLAAIDPIRILALIMPLRIISAQINEVLNARGRSVVMLSNMAILLLVVGGAIAVGSAWGVLGVCVAWVVSFPLAFAVTTVRAQPYTTVGLGDVARLLARPVVTAAVMYAVIVSLRLLLQPQVEPLPLLAVLATAGAFTYAAMVLLVDRPLVRDVLAFARA